MAPYCTCSSHRCEVNAVLEQSVTHYARQLRQQLSLDAEAVADVRQELFLAALGALSTFDVTRACLRTYLDRVLRNAATNILRTTLRERYRQVCYDEVFGEESTADRMCDIDGGFLGETEEMGISQEDTRVTDAVDTRLTLDAFQQTLPLELLVIFRGLVAGETITAIAAQLGIGESLVRYRMKALRKAILATDLMSVKPSARKRGK